MSYQKNVKVPAVAEISSEISMLTDQPWPVLCQEVIVK